MKKITLMLLALSFSFALASEIDINNLSNLDRMPTDEEIMRVIDKYNFDETKKDFLFKETKRKLEQMYNSNTSSNGSSTSSRRKYSKHEPLTRRSR